jgi:hypothetical protein
MFLLSLRQTKFEFEILHQSMQSVHCMIIEKIIKIMRCLSLVFLNIELKSKFSLDYSGSDDHDHDHNHDPDNKG